MILKLNPDQRYIYETCGIITEGTYAIETDRLVLSHDKIFKRISKTKQEQVTFEMFPFYQEKLRFEIKHRTLIGSIDRVFYQLKAK